MVQIPTSLCFLKSYLKDVLNITSLSKYAFQPVSKSGLACPEKGNKEMLEKLAVYFAKMTLYDF